MYLNMFTIDKKMSELFTPYTIINRMLDVADEKCIGSTKLHKLKRDLSQCAPEIMDARFWGKMKCLNIVEICIKYFNENDDIHNIFIESVKRYKMGGFT